MMTIVSLFQKVARGVMPTLVLLCALAATSSISSAQTTGWTTPIPLSPPDANAWFPDVSVDAAGTVHVAWAGGIEGFDTVWYTNSADGDTWQPPNDIAAYPQIGIASIASRPALLVDHDNMVHLTSSNDSVYHTMARADLAYSASSWTSPTKLNGENTAYFTRSAVDSEGRVHLVITENLRNLECENCYHIYYRQSDDGGFSWTDALDVSVLPTGAAKPQLLVDAQDNVHLVWEAGLGGGLGQLSDPTQVMYAVSYNRGESWSLPVEVAKQNNPAPPTMTKNIALGFDKNNVLVAVWTSLPDDTHYFQISADFGRSWSSPQPLRGLLSTWGVYVSRLDTSSMARDSAGNLHLVLAGRQLPEQRSISIFHLTWDGIGWSNPTAVTTLEGDVPEWPRLAIGQGNQLHAVWFVRDEEHVWDSANGNYRVWYARTTAIAPSIAAVPWPTATPTVEPMPTSAPPTPTPSYVEPTLAAQPVEMASMAAIQTEVDEVWIIAKSIAPTLVLFMGIAVVIVLRRR
ncbi:hypothetical protein GC175_10925 [bacterium]|nr:hypothetical protein [bacterium]